MLSVILAGMSTWTIWVMLTVLLVAVPMTALDLPDVQSDPLGMHFGLWGVIWLAIAGGLTGILPTIMVVQRTLERDHFKRRMRERKARGAVSRNGR